MESIDYNAIENWAKKFTFWNQSALVDDALSKGFFSYDDIVQPSENPYVWFNGREYDRAEFEQMINDLEYKDGEWTDADDDKLSDMKFALKEAAENYNPEVLEWYLVDSWMADRLEEAGEVMLKNDYDTWWGRQCTGQSIYQDGVIEDLYKQYGR